MNKKECVKRNIFVAMMTISVLCKLVMLRFETTSGCKNGGGK